MSSAARSASSTKSWEGGMYTLLLGASAINLGANLIADVTTPAPPVDLCLDSPPTVQLAAWLQNLLVFSKSLLVPALAGILYLSTRGKASSIRRGAFYVALFFCWMGDIALLFSDKNKLFFQLGLCSFGVAHLFFIGSYFLVRNWGGLMQWKSSYVLPFIVYGYTLYSIIYHQLALCPGKPGNELMALAVAGYMVVLLANGVTSCLRLGAKNMPSSGSLLVGVVLFVQSDSIIAVTEFVNTLPLERFAIMATYILGLFLMVRGCILDTQECAPQQAEEQPARLAA